jgi:hypothetical protein
MQACRKDTFNHIDVSGLPIRHIPVREGEAAPIKIDISAIPKFRVKA